MSSSKTALLSLLLLVLTFYSVNGRTCTCASFIAEQCDAQENCVWHNRETLGLVVKGDHGICRSSKWIDCHSDEACVITGRHVKVTEDEESDDEDTDSSEDEEDTDTSEEEAELKHMKGHKKQNKNKKNNHKRRLGLEEEVEASDLDWPYNCVDNEYHDDVMDVRSFELLAQKEAAAVIVDHVGSTQHSKGILTLTLVKLMALAAVGLIIGVAVCYKFKGATKGHGLLDVTQETYSSV